MVGDKKMNNGGGGIATSNHLFPPDAFRSMLGSLPLHPTLQRQPSLALKP
jgi:hypothetical protein